MDGKGKGKGWLCLSRAEGEGIVVEHMGEVLTIHVERAHRGESQLAFQGPKTFKISRPKLLPDNPPSLDAVARDAGSVIPSREL